MSILKITGRVCAGLTATALLFVLGVPGALGQMNSDSYKIPSDTISVGGQGSQSGNYRLQDTVGEAASGDSAGSEYKLNAGFLKMEQMTYLSLTIASDVGMSPSISGIAGGTGDGSTSWTVTTDNPAGYTLAVRATTSPAMQSDSSSFADYTPAGNDPDYNWSVGADMSEFGFTPEGSHIDQRYKDNGSACNIGSGQTIDRCWDGLGIANKTVAGSTSANHPTGTTTTIKVRAESGANHIQSGGDYSAVIEMTALPL